MMPKSICSRLAAASLILPLVCASSFAADLLTPKPQVKLPGKAAKFDFIQFDAARGRLLASHTGKAALEVIDAATGKLIKSVPTGAAQDCALSNGGAEYLVSVSKPPQVAMVDAETLAVTGTIPLDGPADLLTYDPVTQLAYVCHDDGKVLWMVSPSQKKVTGTIALPTQGPEDLATDATGKRLFQAMKRAGTLASFDAATGKLLANWPTAPVQMPHGIALVPEADAIAISGGNGKLVLMSQSDGKILSSAAIPPRVDEIAYDRGAHRVYCASGTGKIAVLAVEDGQLKPLGEVTSEPGARSIAVNPRDHSVWIAYMGADGSYVQQFTPSAH
ncbi:MAG TPA: hypothetical protein VHY22_03585 [Chthoniobacteraceae bacterium]|jgi:hypothetical protein|nr:hypothetical protein [Chthoniobacteraceae bacterium]